MDRRTLLHTLAWAGGSLAGDAVWAAHAADAADGVEDLTWVDPRRDRPLPLRLRWPATGLPASAGGHAVVLYSHGLGGSRAGGEAWGQAWAAAGLVVVHLQHPGSDVEAWPGRHGGPDRAAGLRQAISPHQWRQRLADVVFVLDQIGQRQALGQGRWAQVRPQRVGLGGHSFGAHTTLGMAGHAWPGFAAVDEPRLAAFVALSPLAPAQAADAALANIHRPVLCVTGSRDGDVLGNGATPERRRAAYTALPPGRKALLYLQDADHMSFAGQTGMGAEILPRHSVVRELQPRHHALVARLSTDWWLAHLLDDAQARARLAAPAGLAEGDAWLQG